MPGEEHYNRLMSAGIASSCPVELPPGRVLTPGTYTRNFICIGCLNADGQPNHKLPHEVWVQDATFVLPEGKVVFWKDGTCEEVGLPCCQYQGPCVETEIEELWKIDEYRNRENRERPASVG